MASNLAGPAALSSAQRMISRSSGHLWQSALGADSRLLALNTVVVWIVSKTGTTIRIATSTDRRAVQINSQIVTAFDLWLPKNEQQRVLRPSIIRLSHEYFTSLKNHAVPLDEHALAPSTFSGHWLSSSAHSSESVCVLAPMLPVREGTLAVGHVTR